MDVKRSKAEKNFPVFLRESVEKMRSSGKAETVFGPPRKENGRTIIPVARVSFGFGGGYGNAGAAQKGTPGAKQRSRKASTNGDTGLGGGGGMRIIPAGMFEISDEGARFRPVRGPMVTTALTLAGGMLLGMLLSRGDGKGGKGGKGKKGKKAKSDAVVTDEVTMAGHS